MLSETELQIRDGIYEALVEVFRTCIIRYDVGKKTPILLLNKNIWLDIFFLFLHNSYLNDFIDNEDKKKQVIDDLKNDISVYFKTRDFELISKVTDLFEDKLEMFVHLLVRRKRLISRVAESYWLQDVKRSKKSDLEHWVTAENEVEKYLHLKLDDKDAMAKLQAELKTYSSFRLVFINQECVVFDEATGKFPNILSKKDFSK